MHLPAIQGRLVIVVYIWIPLPCILLPQKLPQPLSIISNTWETAFHSCLGIVLLYFKMDELHTIGQMVLSIDFCRYF